MYRFILFICFTSLLAGSSLAEQKILFIRDDEIENVLTEITKPITSIAKVKNIRFNVIFDDSLNAFVIGGRDVFINSGLLTGFKHNPEIFAGVFAHELGHLLAKHVIKMAGHAEKAGQTSLIGTVLGGIAIAAGAGEIGQMLILGGMHMSHADLLKHSRQNEAEADKISAILLTRSGIGTSGLMKLFNIFRESQLGQFANNYFLTHPLSKERITFLKNYETKGGDFYSPEQIHKFYRAALKLEAFTKRSLNEYLAKDVENKIDRDYANSIVNMRKGRLEQGISLAVSIISAEPENPYFHELLGQIYLSNGNARKSADCLKLAYDLAKESKELITMEYVAALIAAGKNALKANELEFAIQKIQTYLLKDPEDPGKLKIMANLYAMKGDKNYSNYYLAEFEYYIGNKEKAKKMLNSLQKTAPKNSPLNIKVQDLLETMIE